MLWRINSPSGHNVACRVSGVLHQRGDVGSKQYDLRYNSWGQIGQIERNGLPLWTATDKDASGRLKSAILGNGLAISNSFDPYTGRLADGTLVAGASRRLHEAYQYDVLGNVSQRLQEWGNVNFTENFGYDSLNRLRWSQIDGHSKQEFEYDDIGNLRKKTGVGTGEYVYPAKGSAGPHAVSSIPGINGTFIYDLNGNMSSGAGRSVDWTSFNMPLKISNSAGWSMFHYGPNHERVKQVRSDNVSIWYAGGMEVETGGLVTKVKTYLPNGIGVEIDEGNASKVYYTHVDRLGSIMAISDETGVVSEQLAYDAWGKRRELTTPATPDAIEGKLDNKGFTAHEMLDKLDLVHMNGRVYDPLVARFISADRDVQSPAHSQSYNRYSYVWNNPTNFTDPSGFNAMQTVEVTGQRICFRCEAMALAAYLGDARAQVEARATKVAVRAAPLITRAKLFLRIGPQFVLDIATWPGNDATPLGAGELTAEQRERGRRSKDEQDSETDAESLSSDTNSEKPAIDEKAEGHILDGDATGGGHRSGTGKPGKSEFPSNWSDDKVKGEITDVAHDPNTQWSKPDNRGYVSGSGTRGGVDIKVVVDTNNNRIVTGYPTNLPKNPK